MELLRKGQKVRRGPDWIFGEQDCDMKGKPTVGVVLCDQKAFDTCADVKWASGHVYLYQYSPYVKHIIPIASIQEGRQYLLELT